MDRHAGGVGRGRGFECVVGKMKKTPPYGDAQKNTRRRRRPLAKKHICFLAYESIIDSLWLSRQSEISCSDRH
jgi:hypothetical protein